MLSLGSFELPACRMMRRVVPSKEPKVTDMSNTHKQLLQTSNDAAEDFSQIMDRMFALRMMVPSMLEDAGPEGRQDSLQCGVGSLMADIYEGMNAISEAHWSLLRSYHSVLIEQGKVDAPYRLPVSTEAAKATGTNG